MQNMIHIAKRVPYRRTWMSIKNIAYNLKRVDEFH